MDPEAVARQPRWFERHPKTTQAVAALVALSVGLVALELGLRVLFGLGNPILYDSNALYGYRPLPNQRLSRRFGPALRLNNLGLRCDEDWDGNSDGKVLFLGDSVTYGGNVANHDLFSQLAVHDLAGYRSCNAGVNAWGVENIHGLLVESGFLPAHYYVTVVIEDDFYRGLSRVHGQLVWCRKPALALEEALFDFLHVEDENRRYINWRWYGTPDVVDKVVGNAVRKLVEVEEVMKAKGFQHLLYVSPTRDQLLSNLPKDEVVAQQLAKYGVHASYLVDAVESLVRDRSQKEALFYDNVHLSRQGHAVWASIINHDLRRLVTSAGAVRATDVR